MEYWDGEPAAKYMDQVLKEGAKKKESEGEKKALVEEGGDKYWSFITYRELTGKNLMEAMWYDTKLWWTKGSVP